MAHTQLTEEEMVSIFIINQNNEVSIEEYEEYKELITNPNIFHLELESEEAEILFEIAKFDTIEKKEDNMYYLEINGGSLTFTTEYFECDTIEDRETLIKDFKSNYNL